MSRAVARRAESTRRSEKRWQRDRTVTGTFRTSVVAKMNFTCGGGSSSVFRKALNAALEDFVEFDQADIVDAGVRGSVHFEDVDMARFHDRLAVDAGFREIDGRPAGTVGAFEIEGACENAGGRRLADAADAGQHPGLRDTAGRKRVGERFHHRVLADQVGEVPGAVFPGENAIRARTGIVGCHWLI